MEESPVETEFASKLVSKLASLGDIAAEIYDRGLNCVLSNEQQLRLKTAIEPFEQAVISRERRYLLLEQAELSLEEFARLLHVYSSYWKTNESDPLADEANQLRGRGRELNKAP